MFETRQKSQNKKKMNKNWLDIWRRNNIAVRLNGWVLDHKLWLRFVSSNWKRSILNKPFILSNYRKTKEMISINIYFSVCPICMFDFISNICNKSRELIWIEIKTPTSRAFSWNQMRTMKKKSRCSPSRTLVLKEQTKKTQLYNSLILIWINLLLWLLFSQLLLLSGSNVLFLYLSMYFLFVYL